MAQDSPDEKISCCLIVLRDWNRNPVTGRQLLPENRLSAWVNIINAKNATFEHGIMVPLLADSADSQSMKASQAQKYVHAHVAAKAHCNAWCRRFQVQFLH